MELAKQVVLITGGGTGIGLALAKIFSEAGSQVLIVSRHADESLIDQESLSNCRIIKCDLTEKASVLALRQKLKGEHIQISVLINNAGIQHYPRLTDSEFDFDGIEREVTTNFTAVVWLSYLFLPDLLHQQRGAAIINIASGLAYYPKTSSAVYSASKAAVHSFSQSLRYQLEGTGVVVQEVILPVVDTAMTRGRDEKKISPQQAAQGIAKGYGEGKENIFVGKASLLPLLLRIVPGLVKNILKKS